KVATGRTYADGYGSKSRPLAEGPLLLQDHAQSAQSAAGSRLVDGPSAAPGARDMPPDRRRGLPSLEREARVRENERVRSSISCTRLRRLCHCPHAPSDKCVVHSTSSAFPVAYFTC